MRTTQIGKAENSVVDLRKRAGKRQLGNLDERFLDLFLERVAAALASQTGSRPSRETLCDLTVAQLLGVLDQLARRETARHAAGIDQRGLAEAEAAPRMAVGAIA
jgi:hypothetical protein